MLCFARRALTQAIGALLPVILLFPPVAAAGLADQVNPLAGTQPGPRTFGGGHNFPGASLPFGMVQWGPDTTPTDRHSGGYDYRDRHITGFSLTHLNGAGCSLYGDFPFLPTTEPLRASPAPRGGGLAGASSPASRTATSGRAPAATRSASTPCGAPRSTST